MYPTPPPCCRHPTDTDTRIVYCNGSPLRLYQVWKGRNKFIFGGRLVFGPDVKSIFLTSCLILAPVILFWAFVAKSLVNSFSHGSGVFLIVVSVIFTTFTIVLLFLTSGRDPGIIPRNLRPPEPDDCDTSSLSTDWGGSQNSAPSLPLTKNVTVNGKIVKVKYCQTCMLYRPPRCSHCSICNNCVDRFDHHCPWVGQCIGKRNYRYFFMFVASTTLLCLYISTCCWINIKGIMGKEKCNLFGAFEKSPVSGILVLYTFVVGWFIGGLTTFHLYLIATNQTTYENFRYQYDQKTNPYNLGCVGNFKEIFWSKIPSSRNKFRAKVKGDLIAGFSVSSYSGRNISPEILKGRLDLEMGKTKGVATDDVKDLRHHVRSFSGLERSRTEPRHVEWDKRINWEITPDNIHILMSEFGTEPCLKDNEKIDDDCKAKIEGPSDRSAYSTSK